MAKKQVENPQEEAKPRFAVVFMDTETGVQIAAGTEDLDKFTKTDLMKMVQAFKDGIIAENKFIAERKLKAEKELNESDKRGNSKVATGVRGTHKVRRPKARRKS